MSGRDQIALALQKRIDSAATRDKKLEAALRWLKWASKNGPDSPLTWLLLYQLTVKQIDDGRTPIIVNAVNSQVSIMNDSIKIENSQNVANVGSGSVFNRIKVSQQSAISQSTNLSEAVKTLLADSMDQIEQSNLDVTEKVDSAEQMEKLRESLDAEKPDSGKVMKFLGRVWDNVKGIAVAGTALFKLYELISGSHSHPTP